jgi:hypothetical protein
VKKNVYGSHPDPTIGDSYWALQLWSKALISRETHLHNIKISTSPTLKRPGAWPGNSKDPQTKKKSF